MLVPVFLMLINDSGKMLQECPVQPLYHSIWVWMECCSFSLVDLQLFAHLWKQIWFEVPLLVCAQLQRDIIKWDLIFHKDWLFLWHLCLALDMLRAVCWNLRKWIYCQLVSPDFKRVCCWVKSFFLQTLVRRCRSSSLLPLID